MCSVLTFMQSLLVHLHAYDVRPAANAMEKGEADVDKWQEPVGEVEWRTLWMHCAVS